MRTYRAALLHIDVHFGRLEAWPEHGMQWIKLTTMDGWSSVDAFPSGSPLVSRNAHKRASVVRLVRRHVEHLAER